MIANRIRVLVADDHPMVRAGLAATIDAEPDMELVAAASDGAQAVDLFREHQPDVVMIDLRMPVMDGVEAIRAILQFAPTAKIIVLSTYQGDEDIARSLKSGAKSYLLKDMSAEELVRAIRDVAAGRRPIPPEVGQKLAEHMLHTPLTPREVDVLKLLAKGLRNKEIAAALSITDQTAQGHVRSILEKIGVHDRTEAVAVAARRGIIHLD
jgi:two-component system NarL family response regulator